MDRAGKEELVSHYSGIFEDAGIVVIAHYSGLSVPEMDGLRHQMADVGGTVKVTKNRLVKLAHQAHLLRKSVTCFRANRDCLFARPGCHTESGGKIRQENDNLVIIGGIMDTTVLDAEV